ncbi:hypothetical protein PBAL39_10835 [Pedobacter sp. BAL39]|uniref:DUF4249 family protein n=1 Tax=Pedobacter sp. BAL39 TaxID=391596 RepID=UPI000155A39D|nr:DUF4249 family protein [Pedobacter sp. BAL39]EDM34487.1 hypothetical protein PBAL39_10835 [Pedobacter sp. BAL39]
MEIIKMQRLMMLLLLLGAMFSSCKKEANVEADYTRPVVQAYLVPGLPLRMKVYYQKYLEDTISYGYPMKGLQPTVSDGITTVRLLETADGVYEYADAGFVQDHKTYTLNFSYLDKVISAQTTVPDAPVGFTASAVSQEVPAFSFGTTPATFVPVTFSWSNPGAAAHFLMRFRNTTDDPVRTDSRNDAAYADTEVLLGTAVTYQTQQMTFRFLGDYQVLLYHINQEYSDAISSSGGTSLNLTNPSTNIVNGLGIFTAMKADSLSLHVYQ